MITSPTAADAKDASAEGVQKDDRDGKPVDFVDIVMLVLAVASVAGILYAWIWDPPLEKKTWFVAADAAICAVFAIEFLFRWHKAGWQLKYPLVHWYEVLGMIPLLLANLPIFRAFRFLRIIVIGVRLARVVYRIFGDKVTNEMLDKVTGPIIESVKRPITVLVVDEVIGVLKVSNIPLGLSQALRENQKELQQMVLQKLKNDPTTGRLKRLPFHDQLVATIIDTSMRVMFEVLADPRVDEFVSDVIEENYYQIREAIIEDLDADEIEARYQRDGQMKPKEASQQPSSPRAAHAAQAAASAAPAAPAATPTPTPGPTPTPTPPPAPTPAPQATEPPAPTPQSEAAPEVEAPAPTAPDPEPLPRSHEVSAAIDAQFDEPSDDGHHDDEPPAAGIFDPTLHDEQDVEDAHDAPPPPSSSSDSSAAVQAAIADAYDADDHH